MTKENTLVIADNSRMRKNFQLSPITKKFIWKITHYKIEIVP